MKLKIDANLSCQQKTMQTIGDAAILNQPKVALFCSVKCPGKLILETYDLAKRFRNEGILVISGFHSPMEQECLRILLRSRHFSSLSYNSKIAVDKLNGSSGSTKIPFFPLDIVYGIP